MQDGNKDGCWFMTIGHVFYQEPCPTFFYSQLYRILLMGGGGGGGQREGDSVLIQEAIMFYIF